MNKDPAYAKNADGDDVQPYDLEDLFLEDQPNNPEEIREKLESALASATAYIDAAAYLLDGVEGPESLSTIRNALEEARESIDRLREQIGADE